MKRLDDALSTPWYIWAILVPVGLVLLFTFVLAALAGIRGPVKGN
jgi:hypothetical protein